MFYSLTPLTPSHRHTPHSPHTPHTPTPRSGARDVNADHAASHLGKAEGVATLLRAVPYHRAARRVTLPMDILMRVSVCVSVCGEDPTGEASCTTCLVCGDTTEEDRSGMPPWAHHRPCYCLSFLLLHSCVTSCPPLSCHTVLSLLSLSSLLFPLPPPPQHGVSQEDIIRGNVTQEVRNATYDVASLAHTHLTRSRHLQSKLPRTTLRAFLPAVSHCCLPAV